MEEANKSVTSASFVCEKCKGTPSMDQIVQSVATYGLISLINDENAWIGFNCPLCEQPWTNIKKFKHEEIRQFSLELGNTIASNYGDLVYHSFPFSVQHPVKGLVLVSRYMKQIELPAQQIEVESLYDDDSEEGLDFRRKLYSSYFSGVKVLGPAITIWWYRDEDIENWASHESESGLRGFPRYRLYDNIYSDIESFCWRERLHIDFLKELNLDWPITHILSNLTKKDLTKAFDFMHILDMPHLQDIPAYITRENQFVGSSSGWSELPRQSTDIISDTSITRNTGRDHEKVSSVVWANFTKDYVQDLLKKRSEKFIDEYITLSKRVDFSYKVVWELKEKYLSDLKKAIESRPERQKLKQIANKDHRLRVLKAEECFPGVKIISQNYEIDQLKIDISKLPELIEAPDSILILGERGTGKGMFAKAINKAFVRIGRKDKIVTVNCGNIVETLLESQLFGYVKGSHSEAKSEHKGALESAENGTIFIDEIGNLPLSLQGAMLGFLQDWEFLPVGAAEMKSVKAMVVIATNKDLKTEADNGNFRKDLYDRIRFIKYEIPPLRKRKEDIPILFDHFTIKHDRKRKLDPSLEKFTATSDCIKALIDYAWPGNIRELDGVVKAIVLKKNSNADRSPIGVSDLLGWLPSSSISEDQVYTKPNELSHPKKRKYGHIDNIDDSIFIELEKQGYSRKAIAQKYGVEPLSITRRFKKIKIKKNNK